MKDLFANLEDIKRAKSIKEIFYFLYKSQDFIWLEYYKSMDKCYQSSDELVTLVEEYAAKIKAVCETQNIPGGSSVAINLKNSLDYIPLFWAVLMAGYRCVLIGANESEDKLKIVASDADVKLIVGERDIREMNMISLNTLKMSEPSHRPMLWYGRFALVTSGTSGKSGIYVHDHVSLLNQFQILRTEGGILSESRTKALIMLPLHHVYALFVSLTYSAARATLVIPEDISPQNIFFACQNSMVTHIPSVPLFYSNIVKKITSSFDRSRLADNKELIKNMTFGDSLELLISGGASLSRDVQLAFEEIGYPLTEGFGMTEFGFSSYCYKNEKEARVLGSLGMDNELVQYRIEDSKILVKSKSMYCAELIGGREIENKNREAYFDTGDCGEIRDNHLYFSGRKKDVIVDSSGENVYPAEIESSFEKDGFAYDFTILGTPYGEREHITMVVQEPVEDRERLISHFDRVNGSLSSKNRVEKLLIYKNAFPRTSTYKIIKHVLREDLQTRPHMFDMTLNSGLSDVMLTNDQVFSPEIMDSIRTELINITNIEESSIHPHSDFKKDLELDSFDMVHLGHGIEELFDIHIDEEEYINLRTLNDWCRYVSCQVNGTIDGGQNETA